MTVSAPLPAPRVPLAELPTPLTAASDLAAALGLSRLWIKRDDLTGLAMGGNKARKLEFLMAQARDADASVIITTGGAQSNHARMTAAAACNLGMHCCLVLCDQDPGAVRGNLLLDHLFGADVRFCKTDTYAETEAAMARTAAEFEGLGLRPWIIPVGGSTATGCLGYYAAVRELAEQLQAAEATVDTMVVAVGSTGTLAGILLGAQEFLPNAKCFGISVSPPAEQGRGKCSRIMREASALLGAPGRSLPEPDIRDGWLGPAYGVPTPESLEAIRIVARTEGILLDPVYTGKAFAGLQGLIAANEIATGSKVLFWHTGGAPALFAFESAL